MNNTQRLDKYLANLGVCARRNVDNLLKERVLTVNGQRVEEGGLRIDEEKDEILLDGKEIKKPKPVYYLLNKPKGIISTTSDERGRKNVMSFIKTDTRLYPVGRLDKDTTGLIILTNDGELTHKLTHPKHHIDKTYELTIKGRADNNKLEKLRNGIDLEDGRTYPAVIHVIQEGDITVLNMTIHEGRNRQIRRMCKAVKIDLKELRRIKIGEIQIGTLKEGQYREITKAELDRLRSNYL
ncbi:MAG TPA: pseudouridine synthase [Patescibacteria group bacterium]|nr:pseudouridine synthase [Patescibacteria group bacterium]